MNGVRFDVLGPLHVRQGDKLLTITGQKTRTVIACLALHPEQALGMDVLLRAAWGDPPPRSAVHQVRKMISTLRLGLHDGWDMVSTSQEGYLLRVTPEQSDLARFTWLYTRVMSSTMTSDEDMATAYEALALWRGRPSEGSLPGGCEERIAELVEQHRSLLLKTFRAFGERGREDELVAVLQVAARIHGEPFPGDVSTDHDPDTDRAHLPVPPLPSPAREKSGGKARPRPGSRSLPRDLRDFSGRVDEIEQLRASLLGHGPGSLVATIHGMGGIGKTTLAVHVAHGLAAEFPDGQLFVNLDATRSPAPQTVRNSLGTLLRQLGVPDDEIPSSQDGRLARWRDLTNDRRLLILLDDAASPDQVEPLMPASTGSACIITSRVVLSGINDASYHRLEVPEEDDCVDMMRRIVGCNLVDADEAAVRSVVRQFDCLPLALRLAGARLATRDFMSFSELAHSLDGSSSPVEDLDLPGMSLIGRLNTSLTSLEPYDLDRYLRLALLPAPELDEMAAAAAIGGSANQGRRTCRRFTDRALLQRVATGAYRIHPLLAQASALHVDRLLPVEEQRAVVRAALEYYRNSVGLIGSARVSPSPGPTPALLFGTLNRAAELSGHLGLDVAFADLCLAWERPVNLYLDTDQQLVVWKLALRASQNHPDRSARGNIYLALARSLWHRNDIFDGMTAARRAWTDAQEADDHLLQVRSLLRISAFSWLIDDTAEGLRHLSEAKLHLEACRMQAGEAEADREAIEITSNEAALLAKQGDFERAARLSQSVIDNEGIDSRVKIMAKVTYASAELGRRNYGKAMLASAAALHEANQIRSSYGRSLALRQMTRTLRSIPRSASTEATEAAQVSRSVALETGSLDVVDQIDKFLELIKAEPDVPADLAGTVELSAEPMQIA